MTGLSLSLGLGRRQRHIDLWTDPLSTTPTDWGTVSYSFTSGFFITNSGALSANANYRYVKIPVKAFWQGVRASGSIQIASPNNWVVFLNDANQPLGTYLVGTNTKVTLSNTGNGVIPWPLPEGTTQIGFNSRTTDTDLTIQALNTRVLVIGDSTSTSSTTGIGDDLATLYPTRTFYQQGIGGQWWMAHVRYRMGINNQTVSVSGGEIPTSGTVACTPTTGVLVHTGNNICCQVRINGVRCVLRFTLAGGTYSLEALDTIAAPVTVADGATMKILTGWVTGTDPTNCVRLADMLTGGLWVVRSAPSINDKSSINYTAMQSAVDDLIRHAARYRAKLVLIGMMNGEKDLPSASYTGGTAPGPVTSQNWLNYIATMNAYMETKAAENSSFVKYLDILAQHVSTGGSTVENINGTDYDVLTNQAASVKLSDYRHETTTVQSDETAPFVQAAIDALGW